MSFISDALRKSQRSHDGERGFSSIGRAGMTQPNAPLRSYRIIVVGLFITLILVLIVLSLLLWKEYHQPTVITSAVVAPMPTPAATRPLTEEVTDASTADDQALPPPSEAYPKDASAITSDIHTDLKSLRQMPPQNLGGAQNLNLQLVVYHQDPTKRFVIINGQRLTEGQSLKEGPLVEQITPNGAVLSYQGSRFQIP